MSVTSSCCCRKLLTVSRRSLQDTQSESNIQIQQTVVELDNLDDATSVLGHMSFEKTACRASLSWK